MPYTDPDAATFKVDFPEFTATLDATITRLIVVAKRMVDTNWTEGDYTRAIELYVAHLLTVASAGAATGGVGGDIVSESLGPISVSYGNKAVVQNDPAGLQGSIYGREFMMLARLNRGGPRSMQVRQTW